MRRAHFSSPAKAEGFTLIEVMVVLVIIGIATSAISLNIAPDPARALRQEAQDLAQRFIAAQSEVQLDGRSIAWQADEEGYRFMRPSWQEAGDSVVPFLSPSGPFDSFQRDDMLHPRKWHVTPMLLSGRQQQMLIFNRERLGAPWTLALSTGSASVSILRDAAGRFSVQ